MARSTSQRWERLPVVRRDKYWHRLPRGTAAGVRDVMSSEANRPPGPVPQPFGPPVGSADWFTPPRPPQPPPLRDSRPAASPPRIVRRPQESPEWAIDPDAIQLALGPSTRP